MGGGGGGEGGGEEVKRPGIPRPLPSSSNQYKDLSSDGVEEEPSPVSLHIVC